MAQRVGLHKSTVSRILAGLAESGYVQKDPRSGKYSLGLGLIGLAGPLLADLDVRRLAHPFLVGATKASGETSALSVWNGSEVVVVEQVPSAQYVKHTQYIGTRYNRWASSSVRVALAQLEATDLRAVVERHVLRELPADDPVELEHLLDPIRRAGLAVNDGLTDAQEYGVSAPVLDHGGLLAGVVTLSAPRARVAPEAAASLAEVTTAAAAGISRRLGRRSAASA